MATRQTHAEQTQLGTYGVHEFGRGDLIEENKSASSLKLRLQECPFCAADPNRPRHHFETQQSPAAHVATEHNWSEVYKAKRGLSPRVASD